ncbi:hypothetical protein BH18ACT1_BH18ACT1_09410 [soil metagenome]
MECLRRSAAGAGASALAAEAVDGVVVARRDGTARDDLKDLAVAVRDQPGIRAVVLMGAQDGGGVAMVATVPEGGGLTASELLGQATGAIGGGVPQNPTLAVGGGRDPAGIDTALDLARAAAGLPTGTG